MKCSLLPMHILAVTTADIASDAKADSAAGHDTCINAPAQ